MSLTLAQAQAAGLRPAIGAADLYAGWTPWDFFAAATTPEKQQRVAVELAKHLPSGRAGVLAARNLIQACPTESQVPRVLKILRLCQPGHAAWQTLMLLTWASSSRFVVDATETRETLQQWLTDADLLRPVSFLQPFCHTADELPEQMTLYRGGTHDEPFLRRGFSWTTNRRTAAHYAAKRHHEHGGIATVLTMTAPREKIALWTTTRESEVVVVDAQGAEVDTNCPKTIRALSDAHRTNCAPIESEMLRLALDNEESWCGWHSDE